VTLICVCLAGTLVFGSVLAMTFANASFIARAAEAFLISRVERELAVSLGNEAPGALVDSVVHAMPEEAKELTVVRADRLREVIRDRAAGRRPGAEIEGPAAPAVATAAEPVLALAREAYRWRLAALIHELRVFSGCTGALFALTTLLAAWRRQDTPCLVLPAGILAVATSLGGIAYCLAQNWFWAFLTGNYIGFWYLVLVGTVASLLADIACNRARVTSVFARALWRWPV
jgi:hypothetical protein